MKRTGKVWTLVADSGSTKTDWLATSADGDELSVKTAGINPYQMDDAVIGRVLREETRAALPPGSAVSAVHFYGARRQPVCSGSCHGSLRWTWAQSVCIPTCSVLPMLCAAARKALSASSAQGREVVCMTAAVLSRKFPLWATSLAMRGVVLSWGADGWRKCSRERWTRFSDGSSCPKQD